MIQYIAKAIRMKKNCQNSYYLIEIDEIKLSDDNWYRKEALHDYLQKYPGSIRVRSINGPEVLPAKSIYGEKYVKSAPNSTLNDNLLSLPRE